MNSERARPETSNGRAATESLTANAADSNNGPVIADSIL
jgi:hypothetical protein